MSLFRDILVHALAHHSINVHFPDLEDKEFDGLLESTCYQALCKIKGILEDDSLADPDCFEKIEAIVCVFEDIGSGCGNRHDFG